MSDEKSGSMAVIQIAASIGGSFFRAYAMTVLWAWFIMPTFGMQRLGMAPAYGLSLTAWLFFGDHTTKKEVKEGADLIATSLLIPAVALGIGWCVNHWWMP